MKNALQTIRILNLNRFWELLLNESDYRYITYKIVPVCDTLILSIFCSSPVSPALVGLIIFNNGNKENQDSLCVAMFQYS